MPEPLTDPTRRRTTSRVIPILVAAALSLTACGSSDSPKPSAKASTGATTTTGDATTTTGSSTSTTEPTTTEATTTTSPDQNPEGGIDSGPLDSLPAGTHYGYLKGIGSKVIGNQEISTVEFDKVEFLTGQAAVDAAHAAGDLPPEETSIPNDYYIVNKNPLLRNLAVIPDAQVFVVDPAGGSGTVPSSIGTAVTTPGLYKIEIVVVRGLSSITAVTGVYLP